MCVFGGGGVGGEGETLESMKFAPFALSADLVGAAAAFTAVSRVKLLRKCGLVIRPEMLQFGLQLHCPGPVLTRSFDGSDTLVQNFCLTGACGTLDVNLCAHIVLSAWLIDRFSKWFSHQRRCQRSDLRAWRASPALVPRWTDVSNPISLHLAPQSPPTRKHLFAICGRLTHNRMVPCAA